MAKHPTEPLEPQTPAAQPQADPSESFAADAGRDRVAAEPVAPDRPLAVDTEAAQLPAIEPAPAPRVADLEKVDAIRTRRVEAERQVSDLLLEEQQAKVDAGIGDRLPVNHYRGLDATQINAISDADARNTHLAGLRAYHETSDPAERAQQELESYGRYVPVGQAIQILKELKGE